MEKHTETKTHPTPHSPSGLTSLAGAGPAAVAAAAVAAAAAASAPSDRRLAPSPSSSCPCASSCLAIAASWLDTAAGDHSAAAPSRPDKSSRSCLHTARRASGPAAVQSAAAGAASAAAVVAAVVMPARWCPLCGTNRLIAVVSRLMPLLCVIYKTAIKS